MAWDLWALQLQSYDILRTIQLWRGHQHKALQNWITGKHPFILGRNVFVSWKIRACTGFKVKNRVGFSIGFPCGGPKIRWELHISNGKMLKHQEWMWVVKLQKRQKVSAAEEQVWNEMQKFATCEKAKYRRVVLWWTWSEHHGLCGCFSGFQNSNRIMT